jgi:hypothetical protein
MFSLDGLVGLKNEAKIDEETIFHLLFLKDDDNQSVEAVEARKIDFEELVKSLNKGESVFIKRIR